MRARVRDTTGLALGSFGTAVLAYVFFMMATRALGADAAAPVSVLWTYWSFAAAALTFPLQHWISHTVAAHQSEALVRDALPGIAATVFVTAASTGLLAWLARDPLFHRTDAWFPLLVAGVTLGCGFVGVVRGGLAARHRFGSLAVALVGENALRCLAAGLVLLVSARSAPAFGVCLVLGSLVGLAWPEAMRFSSGARPTRPGATAAFLGAAAGGQLIGQAVLAGGPVLLALSGGSPADVTALFAGLALFRAPYTLAIGLVSQLTGRLTRLVVAGHRSALRTVRRVVLAATVVATAVAAVVGALAGPVLLRVVFGAEVRLDGFDAALIAGGSAVALGNLVQTVALLAQGRSGAVTRAWLVGVLAGAAVLMLAASSPLTRTCLAFVVTEAVGFVAFTVEELWGARQLTAAPDQRAATSQPR